MNRFSHQPSTKPTKQNKSKPFFSSNDFPDLSTNVSSASESSTIKKTMDYKNKLQIIEPIIEQKIQPGHISLFYDKITHKICIEHGAGTGTKRRDALKHKPDISFEKLVKHWEKWYDEYIELYGQEIYEHVHLYPFYNYNYFNELDNVFYRELEELEKMEEVEYEEYEE